jgi:hypothetical protein
LGGKNHGFLSSVGKYISGKGQKQLYIILIGAGGLRFDEILGGVWYPYSYPFLKPIGGYCFQIAAHKITNENNWLKSSQQRALLCNYAE